MKMKIQAAVFIFIIMFFACFDAMSQKVQKRISTGEVFIDCTDAPWAVDTPLNTTGFTTSNYVYKRLQIATKNCAVRGVEGETVMNWATAVGLDEQYNTVIANGQLQGTKATGCSVYWEKSIAEISLWRVPTQRELLLIQLLLDGNSSGSGAFYGPLAKALGTNVLSLNYYWSSSNVSSNLCWSISFGDSGNATEDKKSMRAVRCVREVR